MRGPRLYVRYIMARAELGPRASLRGSYTAFTPAKIFSWALEPTKIFVEAITFQQMCLLLFIHRLHLLTYLTLFSHTQDILSSVHNQQRPHKSDTNNDLLSWYFIDTKRMHLSSVWRA